MSGVSIYDAGGGAPPHPAEAMELAARHLDRMLSLDASTATLGDRLQGGGLLGGGGVSGLQVILLRKHEFVAKNWQKFCQKNWPLAIYYIGMINVAVWYGEISSEI